MNIRTALIPHKHVRFCDSIVALAGAVRKMLEEPRTVDELWTLLNQAKTNWPTRPSFTSLTLAIDTLFAIGLIESAPGGRVRGVRP